MVWSVFRVNAKDSVSHCTGISLVYAHIKTNYSECVPLIYKQVTSA